MLPHSFPLYNETFCQVALWNDEWAAYNQLNALRYIHQTVNHKSAICGSGHWRSYKQHRSIIFYIRCCLLSIFVVRLLLVVSFRCLFVHLFFCEILCTKLHIEATDDVYVTNRITVAGVQYARGQEMPVQIPHKSIASQAISPNRIMGGASTASALQLPAAMASSSTAKNDSPGKGPSARRPSPSASFKKPHKTQCNKADKNGRPKLRRPPRSDSRAPYKQPIFPSGYRGGRCAFRF